MSLNLVFIIPMNVLYLNYICTHLETVFSIVGRISKLKLHLTNISFDNLLFHLCSARPMLILITSLFISLFTFLLMFGSMQYFSTIFSYAHV